MASLVKSLAATWLLVAALPHQVVAQSSDGTADSNGCTRSVINGFQNPSFETGDMSSWTQMSARNVPLTGEVLRGGAEDGDYFYRVQPTNIWSYLMQPVTGFDLTSTYTMTVSYKFELTGPAPALPQYNCYLGLGLDGWGFWPVPQRTTVLPSAHGTDPDWSTYTISFKPKATSQLVYFDFACADSMVLMSVDNFQLSMGEIESCPVSTPTVSPTSVSLTAVSTPVASSTNVISPPALSSSTAVPSSSAVPSNSAVPSSFASSSGTQSSIMPSKPATPPVLTPSVGLSSSSAPVKISVSTPQSALPASGTIVINSSSAQPSSFMTRSSFTVMSEKTPIKTPSTPFVLRPTPASSFIVSTSQRTSPVVSLTTSIILSTRVSTITSCPTAQPHCPVQSRTTSITTETVVAYTTTCPAKSTQSDQAPSTESTSSIFSTRLATVTRCPGHSKYCPLPQRKTTITTETILVSTTVVPVEATRTVTATVYVTAAAPEMSTHTTTVFVTETQIAFVTSCPGV
ncbi:hypothetical protein N7539_004694 [Penicillium diatomitis]|uniref:Uncharacterized protein n=1 Tax=Penicillium diatomitis TaxID=2819901 RepID=A0A9W9X5W4_9EURO|nr:uncharacterized protein N7539_004694 [Penicillium diatomitis]KAJ5484706.1 hypothetical protein N7539_004694 [Penicillium diatomitis]